METETFQDLHDLLERVTELNLDEDVMQFALLEDADGWSLSYRTPK